MYSRRYCTINQFHTFHLNTLTGLKVWNTVILVLHMTKPPHTTVHFETLSIISMLFCDSVDATDEPVEGPTMGRLLNHSKVGNTAVRLVEHHGRPYVCLFTSRAVQNGEQLCYDYGVTVPFADVVSFTFLSCVDT